MPTMTKLGKYLIRRELGKGAMGIVYEGFDPVIERTVAIKTILPSQLSEGEVVGVLARFKREAQAAGRLNHPGIVAVYDYGEVMKEDDRTMVAGANLPAADGQPVAFIAMEFVRGRELKDYFDASEVFSLREATRILLEILDALDHAHGKGVVHRDIKPANLIVLDDGKVKIADFGIARIETSELTLAGTVMGTPSYMSPEQFQGQAVDFRSDLFSCGVILYQFLTGEKPFVGNMTTIMYKVLREEPVPPSALNTSLPAEWDVIVKRALAKNPADRFQSAREFAQSIHEVMSAQGTQPASLFGALASADEPATYAPQTKLTPVTGLVRQVTTAEAATPSNAPPVAPSAMPGDSKSAPRLPVVLIGAIAAVLVLGTATAYFLSPRTERQPVPATAPPPQVFTQTPAKSDAPPVQVDKSVAPTPTNSAPQLSASATASPATAPPLAQVAPAAKAAAVAPAVTISKHIPARKPVAAEPKAQASTPVAERTPARSSRCALILQKAAMSEPISAEERNFLTSSCQ